MKIPRVVTEWINYLEKPLGNIAPSEDPDLYIAFGGGAVGYFAGKTLEEYTFDLVDSSQMTTLGVIIGIPTALFVRQLVSWKWSKKNAN